jgi:quinol monooxygenase YgiN
LYANFRLRTLAIARKNTNGKVCALCRVESETGKEAEVEALLKQGGAMAQSETGTVDWYGFKEDKPGVFGIFDTFNDEAGREAHLNGEIAKALMAKADEYFAEKPIIHKITLIAEK